MNTFGLRHIFLSIQTGLALNLEHCNCDFSISFDKKELYGRNKLVKICRCFISGQAALYSELLPLIGFGWHFDNWTIKLIYGTYNPTSIRQYHLLLPLPPPGAGTMGKVLSVYDLTDPSMKKPMKRLLLLSYRRVFSRK